jgi:signal transduction histidine kinase
VWWVNSATEQQPLQAAVHWCLDSTEKLDVQAVSQGACELLPAKGADLSQGFKSGAMWLRIQLGNPGAQPLMRWLVVGHPRLQDVTLWLPGSAQNAATGWQALKSGTNTPRRQRAVAASYPVFPVTLAANSVQTVYLRVASQTDLDASVTLWQPQAFDMKQGRLDLLHDLALGGLLLAALFAMMLFVLQRDRAYLFFALSMVGELVLEGCQSGLLADHFWPSDQPFPVGLIAVGFGMSTLFLTLFALQLLGPLTRQRWVASVVKSALGLLMMGELWALFVNFRLGSQIGAVSLQVLMLAALVLLALRYQQGQRQALYLSVAMMPSILVQALSFSLSMGWLPMQASYLLAAPLSLVAMTPLLLLSLVQRSRELNTKLMTSQAINQARTGFLAQMSHDLRAPLNAVLGYSRALKRPGSTLSAGDAALAIEYAGQRLLGMIDEILDYAQGEANRLRLDPAPVHWSTLVQDLSHHGTELAAQYGNRFVLLPGSAHSGGVHECEVTDVLLDERRLRHVLDNLLSNANHYTAGGTVTLSCQADMLPEHMARLRFSVADTGLGIAPEEQERIFEPFVRGTAARRGGVKGTGLGLAIARQLTQLMGGTLTLESKLGSGSRFTLCLSCPMVASPGPLMQRSLVAGQLLDCTTPRPDLVGLQELVEQGAVTDLVHWADALAQQQPAHKAFAAKVRQAALAVDFSTLRRLVSGVDSHATFQ